MDHSNQSPDVALIPTMGEARRDISKRSALRIFALIFALAVAMKLVFLGGPWSGSLDDFQSHFGSWAVGEPAERMAREGFEQGELMPVFWEVELADGSKVRDVYVHHPALYTILLGLSIKLFGLQESSVRLVPFVFSLLAVWAAFRVLSGLYGRRAGLFAAAMMGSMPIIAWYGMLAWTESALVWIALEQIGAYARWLDNRQWRFLILAGLWQMLAGFFDWSGSFLMLGIAVHGLFYIVFREGFRASLPLLIFPLVFLVPVIVHFLHMSSEVSPEERGADTARTLANVITLPLPLSDLLKLQWDYAWRYLGAPAFVLALLGYCRAFVLAAKGRLSRRDGLLFVMVTPGLMYIACFPQRSYNHDFFWMLGAPGLALAAASAAMWLASFFGRRREVLVLGLIGLGTVASGAVGSMEEWDSRRSDQLLHIKNATAHIIDDPDAVILAHYGRAMAMPFYCRAELIHSVDTVKDLDRRIKGIVELMPADHSAYFFFDLLFATELRGKLAMEMMGNPEVGETSAAFDALVASLPRAKVNELFEFDMVPSVLELHQALTSRFPSTFIADEGFGVFEIFDLRKAK